MFLYLFVIYFAGIFSGYAMCKRLFVYFSYLLSMHVYVYVCVAIGIFLVRKSNKCFFVYFCSFLSFIFTSFVLNWFHVEYDYVCECLFLFVFCLQNDCLLAWVRSYVWCVIVWACVHFLFFLYIRIMRDSVCVVMHGVWLIRYFSCWFYGSYVRMIDI